MVSIVKTQPVCESQLTGKAFEDIIVPRLATLKTQRLACIDRPGVHAITIRRFEDGTVQARLIASLPDFQGVFGRPGREVIFDLKVCSQPAFDLSKYRIETRGARSRQLRHMLDRSQFGSVCFFLIHWNERKLKTKFEPAITYAFPVCESSDFWNGFEAGTEKSIRRTHCETHGVEVPWTTVGQERTARPDVMFAFEKLAKRLHVDAHIHGSWG